MSISTDPTYRTVRVAWTNTDAAGDELVQLIVRPLGGAWAVASTFAAVVGDQVASWASALPVTFYDVAMRLMRGATPAVGYEDSDPDNWTSPHAASSKSTVSTVSATVTWNTPVFVDAATPLNLTWISAQLNVPYLLEKNTGSGWSTVVADLVATAYAYTIPAPELGHTTTFRLTAQRGAVVGPTAGTIAVLMQVVVGQPVITSGTFDSNTAAVTLTWTAATSALQYLIEKSTDGGGSWSPIATVPGLTYAYPILPAEANTTVKFRVTGQNGAISGTPSVAVDVACPVVIGVTVLSAISKGPSAIGPSAVWVVSVHIAPPSGPTVSQQIEWSENGVVVRTDSVSPSAAVGIDITSYAYPATANVTVSVRARGVGAGPVYGAYSNTESILV